jgi:hypothetical protein
MSKGRCADCKFKKESKHMDKFGKSDFCTVKKKKMLPWDTCEKHESNIDAVAGEVLENE